MPEKSRISAVDGLDVPLVALDIRSKSTRLWTFSQAADSEGGANHIKRSLPDQQLRDSIGIRNQSLPAEHQQNNPLTSASSS